MENLPHLVAKHASRGLLVDTNLLLLYVVGLCSPASVVEHKRTRKYEIADFQWVRRFAERFHRLITTPHILAELSNLATPSRGEKAPRYFAQLLEIMQRANELYVEKDILVGNESFAKLGLADAGIVELAQRERYLVLTDDFPLAGYLQTKNCEVINFNHVRGQLWRT